MWSTCGRPRRSLASGEGNCPETPEQASGQPFSKGRWMPKLRRAVNLGLARAHLRSKGVEGGSRAIYGGKRPHILNAGRIVLGSSVTIGGPLFQTELHVQDGALLVIGNRTLVSAGVSVHCRREIRIGSWTSLAPLVAIIDTHAHELSPGLGVHTAPVCIGDDVWVGRGAQVLAGTTIGDGSVVAAGAIVTHDVPPWTVVAGVPARPIRELPETPGRHRI